MCTSKAAAFKIFKWDQTGGTHCIYFFNACCSKSLHQITWSILRLCMIRWMFVFIRKEKLQLFLVSTDMRMLKAHQQFLKPTRQDNGMCIDSTPTYLNDIGPLHSQERAFTQCHLWAFTSSLIDAVHGGSSEEAHVLMAQEFGATSVKPVFNVNIIIVDPPPQVFLLAQIPSFLLNLMSPLDFPYYWHQHFPCYPNGQSNWLIYHQGIQFCIE